MGRLWHIGDLTTDNAALKRADIDAILTRLKLIPLDEDVLRVAADPFPSHLNTLDALHLATAILHRRLPDVQDQHFVFATHDRALARAARAMHFEVIGG